MNRASAALLLAGTTFFGGCADGGPDPAAVPASTPVSPVQSSPSPDPQRVLLRSGDLGKRLVADGLAVTVYSWGTLPTTSHEADPGLGFSRIDVKVCALEGGADAGIKAKNLPILLTLSMPGPYIVSNDNSIHGKDDLLVQSQTVRPSTCVRGFVVYQTAIGEAPNTVLMGTPSGGGLEWDVRGR